VSKQSPVTYAEDTLGVHTVYSDAQDVHEELDKNLGIYATQAKRIRQANDAIDQREFDLAGELKAEDPSLSIEGMKRAIKDAHRTDETLNKMRKVLYDAQGKQEDAYAESETCKYRLRVLSARMNELGGLLAFLAAAKSAAARPQA